MKKLLLFVSVLFVGTIFTACSSSDGNLSNYLDEANNGDEENGRIIQPINVADKPIADFFNAELPAKGESKSFFYDPDSCRGVAILENIVCVINSQQELADIYLGDRELPEIDFGKYTLIIGQQIMPYLHFYVAKQILVAGEDGIIFNLYAKNDSEIHLTMLQNLYFWGLYPKLTQQTIKVNVIRD